MARIVRASAAEQDAILIHAYIARDNQAAADEIIDRFEEVFRRVAELPASGRSVEMLAPNLRLVPLGAYLIFYRPIQEGIEVIRILHAARDTTAELFRE